MLSKEKQEELALQLILLGVSLLAMGLVMVPKWKWELWRAKLTQTAQRAHPQFLAPKLSPEQEMDVAGFRQTVSRWIHEQRW